MTATAVGTLASMNSNPPNITIRPNAVTSGQIDGFGMTIPSSCDVGMCRPFSSSWVVSCTSFSPPFMFQSG